MNTFNLWILLAPFFVIACSNGSQKVTFSPVPVEKPAIEDRIEPVEDVVAGDADNRPAKCQHNFKFSDSMRREALNQAVILEARYVSQAYISCDLKDVNHDLDYERVRAPTVGISLSSKQKAAVSLREESNELPGSDFTQLSGKSIIRTAFNKSTCEAVNLEVSPDSYGTFSWGRGRFKDGKVIYFEPDFIPHKNRLKVAKGTNQISFTFHEYSADVDKGNIIRQGTLYLNVVEKKTYFKQVFRACEGKEPQLIDFRDVTTNPDDTSWYSPERYRAMTDLVDHIKSLQSE